MPFNPPPNWPAPPRGWEPGPQWTPDPSWPPPPRGWQLWVPLTPSPGAVRNDRRPTSVQDSIVPALSNAPSRLAVAAIVGAVVVPPVGIALGVVARRQVRRTHQRGAGLAKAAIVVGGVVLALYVIAAIVVALLAWT